MSSAVLQKYIPEEAIPFISQLIHEKSLLLKFVPARASKFGDYSHIRKQWQHKITVNRDLNPYAALVTLIHEIAHLYTNEQYGRKVRPHGGEWKNIYAQMLRSALSQQLFPAGLAEVIYRHAFDPKASSCTDVTLYEAIRSYNSPQHSQEPDHHINITEVAEESQFRYRGRVFLMKTRRRVNFLCEELRTGRKYIFKPFVMVEPVLFC